MTGNEETPVPVSPEAVASAERNSREEVVKAFNDAYSLIEVDPSVDSWTKDSLREAKEKTLDQQRSTFTNTFENHHTGETFTQEEGIPVEDIINYLITKINRLPSNDPKAQDLSKIARIIYENSQLFNQFPRRMEPDRFEGRVHKEAYLISQDEKRRTGDQNSDWFKAIDTLNKRRELLLPSEQGTIISTPEPEVPVQSTVPETTTQTEPEPVFGIDIINYEEAASKQAKLEARKSVTESMQKDKWYKFWHWPKKIGIRLIEPAMVHWRKEKLRAAMHRNNTTASTLAEGIVSQQQVVERFKEERLIAKNKEGGEKRELIEGQLKGLIVEQILKPITEGAITSRDDVRKKLAEFVKDNLNDPQVKAFFGSGANEFGDVAEIFATDILEMGLSIKAYLEVHPKVLQEMDSQINIRFGYARLGHMTDTRDYVDRAVAWAKRRQSENLARGASGLGLSGVILNPAVVGVATALGINGLMRSVGWGARIAALPSFFIGGLAGATVAGARRYYELGVYDRPMHMAERALGGEIGPKSPRRDSLKEFEYKTVLAKDLIAGVDQLEANITQNPEEAARRMIEIEQRLDYSVLFKKDLIKYGSASEANELPRQLLQVASRLRRALQTSGADVLGLEQKYKDIVSREIQTNVVDRDKAFNSYRLKEAGKAAFTGGVVGLAAGVVTSEAVTHLGRALGAVDWQAPSEWIRSFFEAPKPPVVLPSVPDIDTIKSMFPGINAVVEPNGHISVTGGIPPDAQAEMQRLGFIINQGPDIAGATQSIIEQRPVSGPEGEWLKNSINIDHRDWYSYNQSGSQLNELRLYTFKEGDSVILDMSKMQEGFQRGLNPGSINVQDVIKNGEAGVFISRPDDPQNGFWLMDKDDGVPDGRIRLDPNAPGKIGEISRMVLNQHALQQLPDGNIATELRGHQDVFNIGANGKPGFIEAGRVVERGGVNVLQDFATIRGTSPIPETVGVPVEVPGTPTPTYEIIPPISEEAPVTPEETPFIIPIPFAPRHPLEPLRKPGGVDRTPTPNIPLTPQQQRDQSVQQEIIITPEDLEAVTSEQLQETEDWARNWVEYDTLPSDRSEERKKEILSTWAAKAQKDRRLIGEKYAGSLPPLSPTGQENVDWKKQTNPGMFSCQLASVGNALRFLGVYNDSRDSELEMLNLLGGQAYTDVHPEGADTVGIKDNVLSKIPQITFAGGTSLFNILDAVEKGAAVVVPLDPSHVGVIPPGQRVTRTATGELQVQVVDPLSGVRLIPVENLIRTGITLAWDSRNSMGIIIEKAVVAPTIGTETVESVVPRDPIQRRIENIRQQAEARGVRFPDEDIQNMAVEEEAIDRRYGRTLPPVAPIGYVRRQSNSYGMNTCVFASVDNVARAILGNSYDPTKHSEKTLVDALGGQEYARQNPGGFRIPDDVARLENQLRNDFTVKRSNSLNEILQAVERGAGVVLPIWEANRPGEAGHFGAILPGQRLRRREDGVLEIQIINPASGAAEFKTIEDLNRFYGIRVDHPEYYKVLIIEKKRWGVRLPNFNPLRQPSRPTAAPIGTETVESGVRLERATVFGIGFSEDQGVRPTMEDAHTLVRNFGGKPNQAFFGIYDGHGGKQVADFASQNLHENFFNELNSGVEPRQAFKNAYYATDQQIKDAGLSEQTGSTAVTAFVQGKKLYIANAGDARAVLDSGGQARRLSQDHKLTDPAAKARIERAGGRVTQEEGDVPRVEGVLAIARSLGDHQFKRFIPVEPFRKEIELAPNDTHLILACDGVWDVMSDQDAVNLIKDEPDSQKASELLKDEALRRGSGDNISVLVVKLNVSGQVGSPVVAPDITAENLQPVQASPPGVARPGIRERMGNFVQGLRPRVVTSQEPTREERLEQIRRNRLTQRRLSPDQERNLAEFEALVRQIQRENSALSDDEAIEEAKRRRQGNL